MSSRLDRRLFLRLAGAGVGASALGCRVDGVPVASSPQEAAGLPTPSPAESGPGRDELARVHAAIARAAEFPDARSVLDAAEARARSRGVPLLVLLTDGHAAARSGYAWAAYLETCSEVAQADLALCELVYVHARDAYAHWTFTRSPSEALTAALVVDPDAGSVLRVECEGDPPTTRDLVRLDHTTVRHWVFETEQRLRAAIAPDEDTFVRRAGVVLGRVPSSRAACEAELAARWRAESARGAPAGAKWARPDCGSLTFEDGERIVANPPIACGTASTPARSRSFLWLYAGRRRDGREWRSAPTIVE